MSKLSWNALFLNGSIVSVSTCMWRARTKLTAADLGIEDSEDVQKAIALGSHRLMPAKAFEAISKSAAQAKQAVDYFSLNFGLIKGARFVPEAKLEALTTRLKAEKIDFDNAVKAFMADFEKTRDEMLPVIEKALLMASRNPDAAAAAYQRILAEYPLASEVREKFSLEYSVYALSSPKTQAVADAAAKEAEGVKSILGDMVKQLRSDLTEKIQSISAVVIKGGTLQGRALEGAIAMIDRVESLNILGDTELRGQCRTLRKMLEGADPKNLDKSFVTDLSTIQKNLEESVTTAIARAEENLTGVGRRKLAIEPDAPEMTIDETDPPIENPLADPAPSDELEAPTEF